MTSSPRRELKETALIFQNSPNDCHIEVGRYFYRKWYRKLHICQQDSQPSAIATIGVIHKCFGSNIDVYGGSEFLNISNITKCPAHSTLRSDWIVFVVVIVRILIDVGVLNEFGQIFRCGTKYNIIQMLTYCEKTEKKQSLSYRRCS